MNRGCAAYSSISSTVSTSLSDGAWRTMIRDPICYQFLPLPDDVGHRRTIQHAQPHTPSRPSFSSRRKEARIAL